MQIAINLVKICFSFPLKLYLDPLGCFNLASDHMSFDLVNDWGSTDLKKCRDTCLSDSACNGAMFMWPADSMFPLLCFKKTYLQEPTPNQQLTGIKLTCGNAFRISIQYLLFTFLKPYCVI